MDRDRIIRDFTYHPPKEENVSKFEELRRHARNLALLIDNYLPDGREKSTAITNLEQAIFWANAGLARNPGPDVITGAIGESSELEDNMAYPANLVPLPHRARDAGENMQTLLAESKNCGGNCKCKRF